MIKIIRKVVLLLIAGFAVGCSSDNFDSKFDQTPTERIETRKKELNDLLLSSEHGWRVTYFTNNTILGGFTYLFKFKPNGNVEMITDFDNVGNVNSLSVSESEYAIRMSGSISLVFTTGNYIHYLGDNNNYPIATLKGKGYLGDYQFIYIGNDGKNIEFEAGRNHAKLTFEPVSADDWDDLKYNRVMLTNFGKVKNLIISENGTEERFAVQYGVKTRFAKVSNAAGQTVNRSGGVGVGFTKDGAILNPAITFDDGSSISRLVYENGHFTGEVNGNKVTFL